MLAPVACALDCTSAGHCPGFAQSSPKSDESARRFHHSQNTGSGFVPQEGAMKLNLFALLHGSKIENLSRRKKERDAVRIDAAIKIALDELDDYTERRTAFLRLVDCVRAHTPLLKPTLGHGTPGWTAPVYLINRLKNLAGRQSHWIRPCESWQAGVSNVRPAFRSCNPAVRSRLL